jgi:hypothetical protein
MSSPVFIEAPPRAPVRLVSRPSSSSVRQERRQSRREIATPYARLRVLQQREVHVDGEPQATRAASLQPGVRCPSRTAGPGDVFALASWSYGVAHLREQFNLLATVFPSVAHFDWCTCSSPCRTDTCRNAKMNVFCNTNCCPYVGKCGNGLMESEKTCLKRNMRTSAVSVVAAEDIGAGQVLGQYLGEIEHPVAIVRATVDIAWS